MHIITQWFKRQFSNPQIVFLTVVILLSTCIVVFFGDILMPVLTSIVIAYVLEGMVKKLESIKIPRILSVIIVWVLFLIVIVVTIFWLFPLLYEQVSQLIQQLPSIFNKFQTSLLELPKDYPGIVSPDQIQDIFRSFSNQISTYSQKILSFSLSYFRSAVALSIFLILIPTLVFFLLKDKQKIFNWVQSFLPKDHQLTEKILKESNLQVSNYIRGKLLEIIIVGVVSFIVFQAFDMPFSILLAVIVGLSVLIPFIGAAVVTFPVILIAWFHYGLSIELLYVAVAYLIIQALDGNVLVPILFSEVVNLHPIAIIVAILFFGGVWGIWGVFFAIPLATLIQAIIHAWPSQVKV